MASKRKWYYSFDAVECLLRLFECVPSENRRVIIEKCVSHVSRLEETPTPI